MFFNPVWSLHSSALLGKQRVFKSKKRIPALSVSLGGKYSYLQHVVQVERCVKHCAELHTKEAPRTRMQELCNLLTNFALCFDRAHKEKRLSIQNRQHNSFQGRVGVGVRVEVGVLGTNGPMSWALSHQACTQPAEGCRAWDRLTPHALTANTTTSVQTVSLFFLFFLVKPGKGTFLGLGNSVTL